MTKYLFSNVESAFPTIYHLLFEIQKFFFSISLLQYLYLLYEVCIIQVCRETIPLNQRRLSVIKCDPWSEDSLLIDKKPFNHNLSLQKLKQFLLIKLPFFLNSVSLFSPVIGEAWRCSGVVCCSLRDLAQALCHSVK